MSDLDDWLRTRRPEPPAGLRGRITERVMGVDGALEVDAAGGDGELEATDTPPAPAEGRDRKELGQEDREQDRLARSRVDRLLDAARDRLDAARARPGRIRTSAFELLLADALVTYACEAALETEDPVTALEAIAEVGRRL